MKLLLDTHIFLWADSAPAKLSASIEALLVGTEHERLLSSVSLWEMQLKSQLGKLTLRLPLQEMVEDQVARNGFRVLPITPQHIFELASLPALHTDPFDRLLVAVARVENAILLTADSALQAYPVSTAY